MESKESLRLLRPKKSCLFTTRTHVKKIALANLSQQTPTRKLYRNRFTVAKHTTCNKQTGIIRSIGKNEYNKISISTNNTHKLYSLSMCNQQQPVAHHSALHGVTEERG